MGMENIFLKIKEDLEKNKDLYEKAYQSKKLQDADFERELEMEKFHNLIKSSGLSLNVYKRYSNFKFYIFDYLSVIDFQKKNTKNIIKKINYWIKKGRQEKPFLILVGNKGTAKTSLAIKIITKYLKRGYPARYIDKKTIDDYALNFNDREDIKEELADVYALAIDDIFSGSNTANATGYTFSIIDRRYLERKQTIISYNEDLDELAKENNNSDYARLYDRLQEVGYFIYFDYPSLRNEKYREYAKKGSIIELQEKSKGDEDEKIF